MANILAHTQVIYTPTFNQKRKERKTRQVLQFCPGVWGNQNQSSWRSIGRWATNWRNSMAIPATKSWISLSLSTYLCVCSFSGERYTQRQAQNKNGRWPENRRKISRQTTRHNFKHGSFVISTSFHEWEKTYLKVEKKKKKRRYMNGWWTLS